MTVSFKAPLKSSVVNAAFMSRTADTSTVGKVTLSKVGSGVSIVDLQLYINEISAAIGLTGENDITANLYTQENYIIDGDSYKTAIDKLDQALKVLADIVDDGAVYLKEYIDDTNYEADNGLPPYVNKSGIYYNSSTGKIRYYDSVASSWKDIGSGGGGIGYQEFLGTGDGVTTTFSITNLPTSVESILVFNDYLLVNKSDWNYVAPNLVFSVAPSPSVKVYVFYLSDGSPSLTPIGTGILKTEYHTMTAPEISAKQFTMNFTPADNINVLCDVVGGVTQEYGTDFTITSNIFDFNGLGLDGVLNVNDIIRLHYIL